MPKKEIAQYCPSSPAVWRQWLEQNHETESAIWLVYYKAATQVPSLTWSQAVDEALCFGWIDSTKKTIDEARYMQYFSPRKPKSTWSKVNKDKVARLIDTGLMASAGYESIAKAKANGIWDLSDEIENLTLPEDLKQALMAQENALEFFEGQSKSARKMLLHWVWVAKGADTRQKRIAEIARLAAEGKKPI